MGDKTEAAYRRGDMMEKRRRLMAIGPTYCERAPAGCQSASKIDPRSASKIDPLGDEELPLALAPAELVGVVEPGRARWV